MTRPSAWQRRARQRPLIVRGAVLDAAAITRIRRFVGRHPELGRQALARGLCRLFAWQRHDGALATRAALTLLTRLEARGQLRLPPSRGRPVRPDPPPAERAREPAEPEPAPARGLSPDAPFAVRPIGPTERARFRADLERYHYLGFKPLVGESLVYAATLGEVTVAWLAFGAAARYCAARDRWVGWTDAQRRARRNLVVNNVRFLRLPGIEVPHLASRVLGATLRRLSSDWHRTYGHPVWLVETFVDRARFRGTCYRAANWIEVGETEGFARRGETYTWHGATKSVWVRPLDPRARAWLTAPHLPWDPVAADPVEEVVPMTLDLERLPLSGEGGLFDELSKIVDPRHARGTRHSIESMLALAACAVLAGARSVSAVADFAAGISEEDRRRLGGRRRPPSEPTFRRVLGSLDAGAFDRVVGGWVARQSLTPGSAVALDGKVLRGSGHGGDPQIHLLSAAVQEKGTVVAQVEVSEKTNEIPKVVPLLADLDLRGTVVTADALHTQVETARHLVEDRGADYLLVAKGNQPTLEADIATVDWSAFPPSGGDAR